MMILTVFAFLVSCSSSSTNDDRLLGNQGQTELMIVHASPDTPDIQVAIDNDQLVKDLRFRDATPYIATASGEHDVKIAQANTANTGLLYEDSVYFNAGHVSLITSNLVDSLRLMTVSDNITIPDSVVTNIRYANLSPNAGPTNFVLTTPEKDSLAIDGIGFGDVTEFHQFKAALQDYLVVRTSATDSILVSLTTGSDKLQNGSSYTIYLTGLRGSVTGPEQLAMTIVENN
jgi:hypothetical protein